MLRIRRQMIETETPIAGPSNLANPRFVAALNASRGRCCLLFLFPTRPH